MMTCLDGDDDVMCRQGAVLGVLCLVLTAFLSNISKDYLIEVGTADCYLSSPLLIS